MKIDFWVETAPPELWETDVPDDCDAVEQNVCLGVAGDRRNVGFHLEATLAVWRNPLKVMVLITTPGECCGQWENITHMLSKRDAEWLAEDES